YAGEKEQEIDKKLIIGEWELIPLYRDVNRVIVSKTYSFKENGDIEGEYGGKWSFSNINEIKIKIKVRDENEIYKGKVMPSWDWEENKETLIFTTIDKNAVALWGKKVL
ncbi:lipocalin-like domain-containing protein, partial [uncultured Clostridium sp.]